MHDAMGSDLGWIVLGLTVWLAAIGGAVALVLQAIRRPARPATRYPSPLDLLERRFAVGEITREDFDEARARLREHDLEL